MVNSWGLKLLRDQYSVQAEREWHLLRIKWLVGVIRLVDGRVALMVRVHVDDIIVGGEKDACNKFLEKLRQGFPVKTEGKLCMYTGCGFSLRNRDDG